jgi:hypothetical protein
LTHLRHSTPLLLVFIFNSFVFGSKTFERLTVKEGLSEVLLPKTKELNIKTNNRGVLCLRWVKA